MADVKSGDIVAPGDQLCVIEELSPSFGTYEENGIVYSATSGGVTIDLKDRSIMVLAANGSMKLSLPVKGDILIGEMTNVYEQRAEMRIAKINDEIVHNLSVGEIHISNVTRRFVRSMHDVLGLTDIVRAMALNTHTIPVELSLVGTDLGVLHSKCTKCGESLLLTTHNSMYCPRCEYRTTREVAQDYGLKFGLEPRPDLAPRRRPRTYYDDRRPRQYSRGRRRDRRDDRRRRDDYRRRY
jgi:exosome complex component CSL4